MFRVSNQLLAARIDDKIQDFEGDLSDQYGAVIGDGDGTKKAPGFTKKPGWVDCLFTNEAPRGIHFSGSPDAIT